MSGCKDCQRFWCGFNKAVKSFRALSQDLSIITVYITEKCQAKSGKDNIILNGKVYYIKWQSI